MRRALLFVLTLSVACSEARQGQLGEFSVRFETGTQFVVTHPSGVELKSDARAFGFRSSRATYEMQFGSFLIEDRPRGEWRDVVEISDLSWNDTEVTAKLKAADSEIGTLRMAVDPAGLLISAVANDEDDNRAFIALECGGPGGFLGFGAHTHDVDHRGQKFPIWVSEQGIGKTDNEETPNLWFLQGTRHQSYLAVPTMLAPRAGASFGLHSPTLYRSIWDLCATDANRLEVEVWEGRAALVLSPGPSPLDVIEQQTARTGRIPEQMPDWTFGVWMEAIGGTEAVRNEAQALRAAKIPASALWTEDWRGGIDVGRMYRLEEDWRWDEELYPQLPQLIEQLHDDGFRFMTYFNTFVVEDVDVEAELRDGGHLVVDRRGDPYEFLAPDSETSFLADLFQPASREFIKNELKAALQLGIDGWMADFAEWYPADPQTVAPSDGSDSEAAHHRYPVEWAKLNREVVNEVGDDDVVIFHRSGYTGSQSQAHVVWAGDQRTTFGEDDGLATIVPLLAGLSVTGFPVVTHDIAGYISATNPPSTRELFWRWTSLGALAPVMRTHHGRSIIDNWRWDRDAETIAHFKSWADLHTRWFPYWAGLARDASETGAPIIRPLALYAPEDINTHNIKDQFMIGDDILAAPVVTSSVVERQVYLPKGRWYPLDGLTRGPVTGPDTLLESATLGELPMFARSGAVVIELSQNIVSLVGTSTETELADVENERVVRVWLGESGRSTDARGGRFEMTSTSLPASIASVEGGTVVREEANLIEVSGSRVELVDEAGNRHVLNADLPSPLEVTWIAIW